MDSSEENPYMRASQIKPPSRIPSPGKGLSEISESQTNARSKHVSRMPPPPSLKHKRSISFPEPEPKARKTLAERAGETKSAIAATPSVRPVVKGTSLVNFNGSGTMNSFRSTRNPSFSSSVSSRTPSVSSRNTSNGSFSSSVGVGSRPPSTIGRTQSSMAFNQTTITRQILPKPRPASSMENHTSEDTQGKRIGMLTSSVPYSLQSFQQDGELHNRKVRRPQSLHSMRLQKSNGNPRDVSVSTAMSNLRLDEELDSQADEIQAISTMKPPSIPNLTRKASLNTSRKHRIDSQETALTLFRPPEDSLVAPKTPSHIPVLSKAEVFNHTPITPCRTPKISPSKPKYLTKDSNIPAFTGWDVEDRLEHMESVFSEMREKMNGTALERNGLEEALGLYKAKVNELESIRLQLSSTNSTLQTDLDSSQQKADALQQRLYSTTTTLDEQARTYRLDIDDVRREHRNEMDKIRRDNTDEIDRLLRLHRDDLRELEKRAATELEETLRELERREDAKLEEERNRRLREVQELEAQITSGQSNLSLAVQQKDLEIQTMRGDLENLRGELDREQTLKGNAQRDLMDMKETMRKTGVETSSTITSLESTVASLQARIHFLESGSKAQSDSFVEMEARLQDAVRSAQIAKEKLIKEETLRRMLFNQVQELKGNIRVMCRVRPVFSDGTEGDAAKITFPDVDKESKELEVLGKEEKSSLGTITRKTHSFTFDRVFGPSSQNQEVFEEISQLVQSALDGYNVCIFCYGQTGSGKTHTMSSADGMIPRATHQIYETATNLQEKGWTYTMEGSFVEVYNEEINDLLGNSKDSDKKKHEIRHDEQKKQTTVTGLKTVALDSPGTVEAILKQAAANRSVAATKSNERSSRSHSVFILKLVGRNSTTNETSEGTLNLVDLAGSERLKQSGAEGDRMKETQNINKSLSCLGDVIGALGQGKEGAHIPYRNSKLTYLLQYSLGGNSKTLMFVMASPLEAHLSETLTSLKFATKVHNTHIGTAKKTTKIRERSSES